MLNEAGLFNGQNPLFRALSCGTWDCKTLSYVSLTSLIRPHNMVYGIILLTAQKYHAEINLQARLASIFFCKKLVVASGGGKGADASTPHGKKKLR